MNKRDQAILDWTRKNQPKDLTVIGRIVEEADTKDPGIYAMMCIAFGAGREFQKKDPRAPDDLNQAIRDWAKKNRPADATVIGRIVEESYLTDSEIYAMLCIAFGAGRDFQKSNPDAPDGPSAYL